MTTNHKPLSELSLEELRTWLVANDSEASDYWSSVPDIDLVGAVRDNLESFGYESQRGHVIITEHVDV